MSKTICLIHHAGIQGFPYLINTAKVLAQAGWHVDVFALRDTPLPEYCFRDPTIRAYKFPLAIRGSGTIQRLIRFSLYIPWAVALACRKRYSAFIGFDQNGLIAASLAALRSPQAPVLYYSPELHVSADLTSRIDRFKKALERFFSRRAKAIIVQDHRRASILIQDNGLNPEWCFLVPNTPLAGSGPTKRSEYLPNLIRQHGIQGQKVILLHMGTVAEWTCVRQIAETVDNWPLDCVFVIHGWGEPQYMNQLRQIAAKHRPPRIIISTNVLAYDELDNLVRSADIGFALYDGAMINRYEMASGKLYEYMKAGIPVIASDFPTLREIVMGNRAGICVNTEDPRAIVTGVRLLATNPALRRRCGENARRAFVEKYAYENRFREVLTFLDSLICR